MTMPVRGHRARVARTRPDLDWESPLRNKLRVSHEHVAAGAWVWSRGLHGIATMLFAMSSHHVDLAHAVARAVGRSGATVFEPIEAPPSQFPDLVTALHQTLRLERDADDVLDASTSRPSRRATRCGRPLGVEVRSVAGDVVVTGTPGGVGVVAHPPRFLTPGDVTEVEVTGVGVLRNEIVEPVASR